jgi:signal transduction histidine kinase
MKKRLVIILGLLVVLPLAVLIGFGTALVRQEKARVTARYEQLLAERLSDIGSSITRLIEARERELLKTLSMSSYSEEKLRSITRGHRLLRQTFVVDGDGRLQYPDKNGLLTEEERTFLERSGSLWESGESFWSPNETPSINAPAQYQGKGGIRSIRQRGALVAPQSPSFGWQTWFWGEGLHLIFWVRQSSGNIIGAEVERAAMMADVIGVLPVAGATRTPLPEGRIVLVDAQHHPLYQWGAFVPAEDATPTIAHQLPEPLSAWQFRYFTPANGIAASLGRSAIFNIATGLIALALALIAMAFYFYRESARDMREASRRVTFVNQVSHELKTPLTNIRMYAELLENRIPEDDDRSRGYVGVLIAEAQRLSRLITNVLTFASHRRGKLKLHPQPAVVDEVIDSVITSFKPTLDSLGIAVVLEGEAGKRVEVDVDILEQILVNLINNVEKYASQATELKITRQQNGSRTTIVVADNGVGIPKAQHDSVFLPFVRLSNKLTDGTSGTGIGLTIARQLAVLHGGDLKLMPDENGATFELILNTPEAT